MPPHLDRLLRCAQRRTVSLRDAENAVQDGHVKAWLSFGDLRTTDQARLWLYRILRGVPVGIVMSRISRGRRRLAGTLAHR